MYISRLSIKIISKVFAAAIIGDGDYHEWDDYELIKRKQEQNAIELHELILIL